MKHSRVSASVCDARECDDVRLQAGPRGRHRLRDRDRRARQGGRRAALPRRRHRGPDRPGLLRQRVGAAGRRPVRARACRRPSRSRCRCTPATSGSTCSPRSPCWRPYWGLGQLLDIDDEQAREDLARVSVTALSFVAQSARGLGLPAVPQKEIDKAHDDRRAVHEALARRARPAARQGRRRLLHLGRRARHERLHLHRPGRRLHRRRRRGLHLLRHRRAVRPAARRRARPGCCT